MSQEPNQPQDDGVDLGGGNFSIMDDLAVTATPHRDTDRKVWRPEESEEEAPAGEPDEGESADADIDEALKTTSGQQVEGEETEEPEEAEEAVEAPPAAPPGVDVATLLEQKIAFVVDGKEQHITVDELRRKAQKADAAELRLQAAATQRKQALELADAIKKSPLDTAKRFLASEIGEEAAENFILQQAVKLVAAAQEFESLSPEEQRQRQAEKRYSELERKIAEQEKRIAGLDKETEDSQSRREQMALAAELYQTVAAAGLKQDPDVHKKIALLYDHAADLGRPISMDDAVKQFLALPGTSEYLVQPPGDGAEKTPEAEARQRAERVRQSRAAPTGTAGQESPTRTAAAPKARRKKQIFRSFEDAWNAARGQ